MRVRVCLVGSDSEGEREEGKQSGDQREGWLMALAKAETPAGVCFTVGHGWLT